jgi:hypothetical protein
VSFLSVTSCINDIYKSYFHFHGHFSCCGSITFSVGGFFISFKFIFYLPFSSLFLPCLWQKLKSLISSTFLLQTLKVTRFPLSRDLSASLNYNMLFSHFQSLKHFPTSPVALFISLRLSVLVLGVGPFLLIPGADTFPAASTRWWLRLPTAGLVSRIPANTSRPCPPRSWAHPGWVH